MITFSSRFDRGVEEIHGFKLLNEIDVANYPQLRAGGYTPLCDALYSSIGAMNKLGAELTTRNYGVNGICIAVTDGAENNSTATRAMVREEAAKSVTGETLESMITILVGVNAVQYKTVLEKFKTEVGITQYLDAGEATPGKIAKLAAFVSQSVSSQAQARGTGGPSQNIAATI